MDSRGYNSSSNRILHLKDFNIYENIDGDLFHDIFEIARNYTENGEYIKNIPFQIEIEHNGKKILFVHYAKRRGPVLYFEYIVRDMLNKNMPKAEFIANNFYKIDLKEI